MSRWPSDWKIRFWSYVEKGKLETDCWLWTGPRDGRGYGQLRVNGPKRLAHRVVYELCVGTIPDGHHIDHLCRNPLCVNPRHLEPVTPRENTARGIKGRLTTHCPAGHAYDEVNTYIYVAANGNRHRRCRKCVAAHQRAYQKRKREGVR